MSNLIETETPGQQRLDCDMLADGKPAGAACGDSSVSALKWPCVAVWHQGRCYRWEEAEK